MHSKRVSTLLFALIALVIQAVTASAAAQTAAPPVFSTTDANGIDVSRLAPELTMTDVSIGPRNAGGLTFERFYVGGTWLYNWVGTVRQAGSTYTVSIGDSSETFTLTGGFYVSNQALGSTLVNTGDSYIYTTADGATGTFSQSMANNGSPWGENAGLR